MKTITLLIQALLIAVLSTYVAGHESAHGRGVYWMRTHDTNPFTYDWPKAYGYMSWGLLTEVGERLLGAGRFFRLVGISYSRKPRRDCMQDLWGSLIPTWEICRGRPMEVPKGTAY